jgi:pilus assembly protein CpaB
VNNRRVLILVVAIFMAAVTAFASFNYLNSADERALKGAKLVEAFVVKQDIPKGFPGERAFDEGYIVKEKVPQKFYPPTAVVDSQTVRGKVAVGPISIGQYVVGGSFVEPRAASESFAQRIGKGNQAITISVDDVHGVARLVVPGDKVNMILTEADKSQYMLQALNVLAIGNSTTLQPGEAAPVAATQAGVASTSASGLMTFEVTPEQAARIALAQTIGGIYLTLVPPDFTPAPVAPVSRANLFT